MASIMKNQNLGIQNTSNKEKKKMKRTGKERKPAKGAPNHLTHTTQSKFQAANAMQSCQITKEDIPTSGKANTSINHSNTGIQGEEDTKVNKTSNETYIWKGKESDHLAEQTSQRSTRKVEIHKANKSVYNYAERKVSSTKMNVTVEENSLSSGGLLPNPMISSSKLNTAAHGTKEISNKDPAMHKRYDGYSQWKPWQRRGRRSPYSSLSYQMGRWETEHCEKIEMQSNDSSMDRNNSTSMKGPMVYGRRAVELHGKPVFPQKGLLQVPFQQHHYWSRDAAGRPIFGSHHIVNYSSYCLVSHPTASACGHQNMPYPGRFQAPVRGWRPQYNWVKIPLLNHAFVNPDAAFRFMPLYSRFKVRNEYKVKSSITPGVSAKKWVPVGLKESCKGTTSSISTCNVLPNSSLFLSKEKSDSNLKGNGVTLYGSVALSDSNSTSLVSGDKSTLDESEARKCGFTGARKEVYFVKYGDDGIADKKKPKDSSQYMIGSEMITEALNAAYKEQLASESFERVTGYPVAEFEKFLRAAAPVVGSLSGEDGCVVCSDSQQPPMMLCKHQIPDVSLNAVWNWYEEPGNYGLEIKVETSHNFKELLTEPMSFCAYFVPLLSAVQLFGYRDLSSCCRKNGKPINLEMQEQVVHSFEEPFVLCEAFSCWGESELVFEFFESKQPHQRKPLHLKLFQHMN